MENYSLEPIYIHTQLSMKFKYFLYNELYPTS